MSQRSGRFWRAISQFLTLTLVELTNWRWTWRRMLLLGMITPIGTVYGLKLLLGPQAERYAGFLLCGNLALSLMFENQNRAGDHFVFMRFHGTLDYFGSLPISKYTLVLSVTAAFLILSLPSLILVLILGSWVLGVTVSLHFLFPLVVLCIAASMAAIGAAIGMVARNSAEATSLGFLITMIMAGCGPVIIPADRLPQWMLMLGTFNPASYAASALRQTVLGPVTISLAAELLVLIAWTVIGLWLVCSKIDWRQAG
jgi:ABC-2 type transport system permease protein